VALVFEAFAEFSVAASDVFAQGVAAGGLILFQGVMWLGILNCRFAFIGRHLRTRDQNGEKEQDED
jgi:hypothetical protein